MLERVRQILGRFRFDPARSSLGWWLAAGQVLIVLLVAAGIVSYAIGRLRDLADEQGAARVRLAGAMAREDLRRIGEDVLTSARVLADRPTLQRLVGQHRSQSVELFLRRFCEASGMDACAVFQGGMLIAGAGEELPWSDILNASAEQTETFLAAPEGAQLPVAGAFAPLSERPDARVFIVRRLDERLARTLSKHVGLDVRLLDYRAFANAPVNDFTALHSAALTDGRSAVQRIGTLNSYASSVPVVASTGEVVALIETRLPAATIDDSASRLIRRLLVSALGLGLLAVLAGIVLTRVVTRPIRALTTAAVRLGEGDFSASIPTGGAAEVGLLARTMENMRCSLVDLTSTLRRREAEAQAVLAGIIEGVYAVDANRFIRYLNPQAAKLLGVGADEAVGRFCGDVLKPRTENGRRPCEATCPILQARVEGTARAVETLQTSEGDVRTTVITSSQMIEGLQVQVIRDETELEAVRRARDSVLANISHEFRTPLAAQLASIELLRDGLSTASPQQLEELVASLERGTRRLTRLIDNLLESVRIESGQLGIRRQSVDLAEVVDDARSLVESLLAQRRQELEVALPEDLPLITGDKSRLTQVFVNLLANASKFAPEESVVRIGAAVQGARLTAWVEDEGAGPHDSQNGAIFERFRRGPEEEPEPGGLGLGLWIVKSIVDRHGGAIETVRTADARTRFSVTLPVDEG